MAAEGVRCTDFYMASPVCSPSRGALMTGCYPPRIGFASFDNGQWVAFPGNSTGLNPQEVTLPGLLKSQGYATLHVGKWHCGDQLEFLPIRYGFDHYYGIPYSNDMGRQAGRPHLPPLPLLRDDEIIQQQPDQAALTERYVEECVRFMRENRAGPFFLYLGHMYVHLPIYPPAAFLADSANGSYGAAVACVDWAAGALFNELKNLGLDEHTLVIFTSDNGSRGDHGGSNAPLRGRKGTCWEGGQRVACILRWPGQLPAGKVCREMWSSLDFLPSLAHLAGADFHGTEERPIDGLDVVDVWRGQSSSPRQEFYYYLKHDLLAVRSGKWKLHLGREGKPLRELYDLEADLAESRDLADQYPEVVSRLELLAEKCREDLGDDLAGANGVACREPGRVENPKPLTQYDVSHPYMVALYDLDDAG
jgi:arylsulfatase A-like enzyme